MTVVDYLRPCTDSFGIHTGEPAERGRGRRPIDPSPLAEPHAGLADLVSTEFPAIRLSGLTLAPATRARLDRMLGEQRQRDLLAAHGLAPASRLLFTGPPGTGKSLTAAALAAELALPLVTIRVDPLLGAGADDLAAARAPVLFDAMAGARAVCLFDDFDAIGARQAADSESDLTHARRLLDGFLTFLASTRPDSLAVTVAEQQSTLDEALLRRFDAAIAFTAPGPSEALALLRRRLAAVDTAGVGWEAVTGHLRGLSQARLARAADSAAKRAVLEDDGQVSTALLVAALGEQRGTRFRVGFGY